MGDAEKDGAACSVPSDIRDTGNPEGKSPTVFQTTHFCIQKRHVTDANAMMYVKVILCFAVIQ